MAIHYCIRFILLSTSCHSGRILLIYIQKMPTCCTIQVDKVIGKTLDNENIEEIHLRLQTLHFSKAGMTVASENQAADFDFLK